MHTHYTWLCYWALEMNYVFAFYLSGNMFYPTVPPSVCMWKYSLEIRCLNTVNCVFFVITYLLNLVLQLELKVSCQLILFNISLDNKLYLLLSITGHCVGNATNIADLHLLWQLDGWFIIRQTLHSMVTINPLSCIVHKHEISCLF